MGRRAAVVVAAVLVVASAPAQAATATYDAPVAGEVVVDFAGGTSPYGPGHRGVDLAALPGTLVRAAGAGRVAFAGRVAGTTWVSLDHDDGLRTAYGPVTDVRVRGGQQVQRGDVLAAAVGRHDGHATLHWSARRGDRGYLDPLTLLGGAPTSWRPTLVGAGAWQVTDLPALPHYDPWDGEHHLGLVPSSPLATGPGWVLPPNPNHIIGVAGFTSDSSRPAIDLTHLGYDPRDITYLSHAGRREVPTASGDPWRDQLPYRAQDTLVGIDALAARLEDQLRAQQRREPGRAVDLVGHSMGGVVIVHYLLTRHDPADPGLPPIDHVATIASPLQGADTASGARGLSEAVVAELGLRALGRRDEVVSPSTRDLAVGSPLLRELAARWQRARDDPWRSPLATGTDVLTIGASQDHVVSEHRSDLPGAPHVVVPGGHSAARDTEASRWVLRAFLANRDTPGEDGGVGHLWSYVEGTTVRGAGEVVGAVGDLATWGLSGLWLHLRRVR